MSVAPAVAPGPLELLLAGPAGPAPLRHVERLPARAGQPAPWPAWVWPVLRERLAARGVAAPWRHQATAARLAWAGRSVVVATGTASGKSLAYQLPALSAVGLRGQHVLYLAPTKALAGDQLAGLAALDLPGVRAACYDGDSSREERDWARAHANVLLANPDIVHAGLLPAHPRWAGFLRRLAYVVVDECHVYRGVFGSHVAQVLRRLRRVGALYGAEPTFLLASATVAAPAASASRLTGTDVVAVVDDAAPRAALEFAVWHPGDAQPATPAETGELLARLVAGGVRTLAFVRSRAAAEAVAASARTQLGPAAHLVAAYRGGFLAEERRALEAALRRGDLLGLATTSALELGVDVAGLDAVLIAGWPGTVASLWQQAGRAGRGHRSATAVFLPRPDPLDSYLARHPDTLVSRPVEATVFDPANPYVLAPHLCAAAAEAPLREADLELFGPAAAPAVAGLVAEGLLRARPAGVYWTRRESAHRRVDLRGGGPPPVLLVEADTGALLGTADTLERVHPGAVYVHQGRRYLVRDVEWDASVALLAPAPESVDYTTCTRESSSVQVRSTLDCRSGAGVSLSFGELDVSVQVVSYLRRHQRTGAVLGETPLDLPARHLRTRAVWWAATEPVLAAAELPAAAVPGAAHAAEHAAIGLLPLFATCDRWDVGGLSTAWHPATGAATVFVYDGYPGGAGFAERGFAAGADWLAATRALVAECACEAGCPSCVHSPKCGNGNEPLDKPGAARLLAAVLERLRA